MAVCLNYKIVFLGALCFALAGLISQYESEIGNAEIWVLVPIAILAILLFFVLLSISFQPKANTKLTFSVSTFTIIKNSKLSNKLSKAMLRN